MTVPRRSHKSGFAPPLRLQHQFRHSPPLYHPYTNSLSLLFSEPRIPVVSELLELFRNSPLIEDPQIHADVVLDASEESSAFPNRISFASAT